MKLFKKICKRCNEIYQPNSKFSRICEKCYKTKGGLNKLTINKLKCPFLATNKFCTHKENGVSTNFHRSICEHKNCNNCVLFLEWLEELHLNQKGLPESLRIDLKHVLYDT